MCVGGPVDPGLGSGVGNALRGTWSGGVCVLNPDLMVNS